VKQLVLDLIPAPLPTFDNFVRGANGEALEMFKQAGSSPGIGALFRGRPPFGGGANASKVLYLWGVSGSGKTHLVRALKAVKPEAKINDGVEQLNDAEQIQLFNQINLVNEPGESGFVVATGNVAPRDLSLRPELSSRLGSGLVYQLQPLTDVEKADALRAHAKARGFLLRDDVTQYLLRHSRRDMASLISFLDALDRYSLETGREITLPLLREMSGSISQTTAA
jgi:DnaA-homolog protein